MAPAIPASAVPASASFPMVPVPRIMEISRTAPPAMVSPGPTAAIPVRPPTSPRKLLSSMPFTLSSRPLMPSAPVSTNPLRALPVRVWVTL